MEKNPKTTNANELLQIVTLNIDSQDSHYYVDVMTDLLEENANIDATQYDLLYGAFLLRLHHVSGQLLKQIVEGHIAVQPFDANKLEDIQLVITDKGVQRKNEIDIDKAKKSLSMLTDMLNLEFDKNV